MDWNPETILLLRKHLGDNQEAFAHRLGLRRRYTVTEWEAGRRNPGGAVKVLFEMLARESGFTEKVAARLRAKLQREDDGA